VEDCYGGYSKELNEPELSTDFTRTKELPRQEHRFHGGRDCTGLGLRAPVCKEFFLLLSLTLADLLFKPNV